MSEILVTGAAGFIGFHVCRKLLDQDHSVIGVDNYSPYYDVNLKKARIKQLAPSENFTFLQTDLADRAAIELLFERHSFDYVINLAAQPGVRYSLENPHVYIGSNVVGFMHILEGCRHHKVDHLIYASSSSVYGANKDMPFSVYHNVDHPISLYAATKKTNELMAHTYSHQYNIPTTGLRFFTVYGPWGRPDMAMFKFTRAILAGYAIEVYNYGDMERDFTYVDDIVEGIVRVMTYIPKPAPDDPDAFRDPVHSTAPYHLYNIGNNQPVKLMHLIKVLEEAIGKKAQLNLLPMQPGDLKMTFANIDHLMRDVDFKPATSIEEGVDKFVRWYRDFYDV